MSLIKGLWASVQGDPVFMRRVNGWLTILWLVMIPVSIATHWLSSVIYVSALSLWALVSGHWSAWQAARVEVAQKQAEARRENVASEVVEQLVESTTIEPIDAPGGGGPPSPARTSTPEQSGEADADSLDAADVVGHDAAVGGG